MPRPAAVGPGPGPPWSGRSDPASSVTRESVEAALGLERADQVVPLPDLRDAAVLVPFTEGSHGVELVFVKRGSTAPSHAGEVAFPGGMCDAEDPDPVATALREANEEVGLDPADVEVLGQLERVSTVATAFVVTPVVAWVRTDQQRLWVPQPDEIDAVLHVPVAELVHPDAYHSETWIRPQWQVHFFEIEGETIWGLTARILNGLLQRVFLG